MSDLTRPDRGEAAARLEATLNPLGADEAALYARMALTILATHAPDVLTFLFDRVDAALDTIGDTIGELVEATS